MSPEERAARRARSLANLRPWKPGQSGNPDKKGFKEFAGLRGALHERFGEDGRGLLDRLDALSQTAENEAVRLRATLELAEFHSAKAPQNVELTGQLLGATVVKHVLMASSQTAALEPLEPLALTEGSTGGADV